MKKIDGLLQLLQSKPVVYREDVNDTVGSRCSTSLIESLEDQWYVIEIGRDRLSRPVSYKYKWYVVPLKRIYKEIETKFPEFAQRIRDEYYSLTK